MLSLFYLKLNDWLGDKSIIAQDETYRDAKNIHSKYVRHQAFESEIAANKERLEKLQDVSYSKIFPIVLSGSGLS